MKKLFFKKRKKIDCWVLDLVARRVGKKIEVVDNGHCATKRSLNKSPRQLRLAHNQFGNENSWSENGIQGRGYHIRRII